jgi:hypothetical protein
VSWLSVEGQKYYILVHGDSGAFTLSGTQNPPNDICQGAETLSLEESSTDYNGSTLSATATADAGYFYDRSFFYQFALHCPTYNDSPGVWFKVVGIDGVSVSIDTCMIEGFQPHVAVQEGSCDEITCGEASYSDACGSGSETGVTWETQEGKTYYIFVHGDSEDDTGDFVLNLSRN